MKLVYERAIWANARLQYLLQACQVIVSGSLSHRESVLLAHLQAAPYSLPLSDAGSTPAASRKITGTAIPRSVLVPKDYCVHQMAGETRGGLEV